ncbi:MAG: type II toxin-antitoxin system VapC family toxin [Ginsengibacter sp.]
MAIILSDTNIIIYLLDGDKAIAELFDQNTISISFITELELLSAKIYSAEQEERIKDTIQKFKIYEYDNLIKDSCIYFRKKYTLKLPDAIIAATAFTHKIPLFTADKNFSKITEMGISLYTF